MVSPNYLAMTDAEFEAHWEAQARQINRMHLLALMYSAIVLVPALVALFILAAAVDMPSWAASILGGVEGVAAPRLGLWLAQRREVQGAGST